MSLRSNYHIWAFGSKLTFLAISWWNINIKEWLRARWKRIFGTITMKDYFLKFCWVCFLAISWWKMNIREWLRTCSKCIFQTSMVKEELYYLFKFFLGGRGIGVNDHIGAFGPKLTNFSHIWVKIPSLGISVQNLKTCNYDISYRSCIFKVLGSLLET